MEFHEILAILLAGDKVQLKFQEVLEVRPFRNHFAVYFYRQIKKLRDCGMASEYEDFKLSFELENTTCKIQYSKKEKRDYGFSVVELDKKEDERS